MKRDLLIRYHGNRDTRRQDALNKTQEWTTALENETVRPVVADSGRTCAYRSPNCGPTS